MVRNTKRIAWLVVLFFGGLIVLQTAAAQSAAQSSVRVQGYLEHQYSVSYTGGNWTHLDYDRVRADVSARAGKRTQISVAPVWQIFRGDTRIQLRDVLPDFLDAFADTLSLPIEDRLFLNHAYIKLRPGPFDLTVGKQYLAWGAGLVFNPTELFRPKNALEPGYEREGIGAFTLSLPLGPLSDVLVGFVPDGGLTESGKLLRVRHHIGGFDVSALVAVLDEQPLTAGLQLFAPERQQRVTLGGDLTGSVLGLGAWLEATWSDMDATTWLELTTGTNYTLDAGTALMAEAHYNGRGGNGAPYSAGEWAGSLSGVLRTLNEWTFYGAVLHPVDDYQLWNVGLSALVSGDGSAILIPSVAYAFAENVDLLFNGLVYAGEDGKAYGGKRAGAFIRARVYF